MWQVGNVKLGAIGERVHRPTVLGNPFYKRDESERRVVILKYRAWLWKQLQSDTPARREIARLAALPDGVLVCFCAPKACHANVIAAAIEWYRKTFAVKPNGEAAPS